MFTSSEEILGRRDKIWSKQIFQLNFWLQPNSIDTNFVIDWQQVSRAVAMQRNSVDIGLS